MAFVTGDNTRILTALNLPVTAYTIQRVQQCMDTLTLACPTCPTEVRALLTKWETAQTKYEDMNTSGDGSSKVLVKADVLEWEVVGGGGSSGPAHSPLVQMNYLSKEISRYLGDCMGTMDNFHGTTGGVTVYRS